MNTHGLVLVRSDTGDGGWSLHPPEMAEPGVDIKDIPMLMSAPARQSANGRWDRPNQQDYNHAWQMYQVHLNYAGKAE